MNTQNKIFSFKDVTEFINKCLDVSREIKLSIDKIAKIEPNDKMVALIRIKRFIFIGLTLKFFNDRTMFIRRAISLDDKTLDLDVLKVLLRGLIEIYCHILYVNAKERNIKSFIWQELTILSSIEKNKIHSSLINSDYKILKHFDINIPKPCEISSRLRNHYETLNGDEIILNINRGNKKKNMERLQFPGVKEIIKNYHNENEEPKMSKKDLYFQYSRFSEQIHSNLYYEGYSIGTEKYQVARTLIFIHLKFLLTVSKIVKVKEEEVNNLFQNFKNDLDPKFVGLWKMHRHINGAETE